MKGPDSSARAALAAVIRKDIAVVQQLTDALDILPEQASYPDAAGVGYTLHNIYFATVMTFNWIRSA